MEDDIPVGNSNRENGTTFSDFPLFLGIFQWDEPTKRVPFTAEPEIPEILTKWKAPMISVFVHSSCGFIHSALFPPISRVWSFSIPRREQEQEVSKPLNIQTKLSVLHWKSDDFCLNNNGPSCKKFRNIFYFQVAT